MSRALLRAIDLLCGARLSYSGAMTERLLAAVGAALLVVVGLAMSPEAAAAQARDEEAHGLYLAGAAAYEAGNYEDALGYFQRSYELSPHPELLFNIGQAADRARRDEVALDAFRRYLASDASIEQRDQIEARVRALEAAVARGEAAVAPSGDPALVAEGPVDTERPSAGSPVSSGPDAGGIGLTVAGGVLVIAGVVMLAFGVPETGALANPGMDETYASAQARQDLGSGLVGGGIAVLGVGFLLAMTGAFVLSASPSSEPGMARLTPNGFALTF